MEFQNEMYEFPTNHTTTQTTTSSAEPTFDQQCPLKTNNNTNSFSNNKIQHSDNNGNNVTTNGSTEQLEHRKPVLRRVIWPILMLMRLFGLYFNDSSDLDKFGVSNMSRKLWKCYAVVVNLVIALMFLKSLIGMCVSCLSDHIFIIH